MIKYIKFIKYPIIRTKKHEKRNHGTAETCGNSEASASAPSLEMPKMDSPEPVAPGL